MNFINKINHTILRPNATKEEILEYCQEAKDYGFASVCVNGYWVELVSDRLKNTGVNTCCVVGFPLGTQRKDAKCLEAIDAMNDGAAEIEMVANIGAIKDHDWSAVEDDICRVVDPVKEKKESMIVKVIIETCLLTEEEKRKVCQIAEKAGADFVKTSTGFSFGSATAEDIKLMRSVCNRKIEASGEIRTREFAEDLIEAGADQIGTSHSIALLPWKRFHKFSFLQNIF